MLICARQFACWTASTSVVLAIVLVLATPERQVGGSSILVLGLASRILMRSDDDSFREDDVVDLCCHVRMVGNFLLHHSFAVGALNTGVGARETTSYG